MDHIYENIDEYSPNKQGKILILFDDVICLDTKKLQPIITELFIRSKKANSSLIFIIYYFYYFYFCFAIVNSILKSTQYLIMKISIK